MKRLVWILAIAACGDDAKTTDAGPKDAALPVPDIDNGSCGDQLRFTGDIVDWDETAAAFCGVFDATVMDGADGSQDTTAPNGRFDLCVPAAGTQLTVTPPANASMCDPSPGTYTMPAILVANKDVVPYALPSGRLFTDERRATFFAQMGVAFDATKAQVLVHMEGTVHPVSLAAAHAPGWAFTNDAWAAGESGGYVFFPNVDVGSGTTMLTSNGGAIGVGQIPLAANTITFATLYGLTTQ